MTSISIQNLAFHYLGSQTVLDINSFEVSQGEIVFLHGPSGCGKTTLLGLIAGVLTATEGNLSVLGNNMIQLSGASRDHLRARSIGYIFQVFNLVPYLSVGENITLPMLFGRKVSDGFESARQEAESLSQALGIGNLLDRSVLELSIGQQQRVAAARALIGSPGLILADEPTSALDSDARLSFLEILFSQARREKASVLFVSHDLTLASKFDRELSLPQLNKASRGHL